MPALLALAVWAPVQGTLVDQAVLASPVGQKLPDFEMQRETILAEAQQIAAHEIEAGFNPESNDLAPIYAAESGKYAALGGGIAILIAIACAFFALRRIKADFRARSRKLPAGTPVPQYPRGTQTDNRAVPVRALRDIRELADLIREANR